MPNPMFKCSQCGLIVADAFSVDGENWCKLCIDSWNWNTQRNRTPKFKQELDNTAKCPEYHICSTCPSSYRGNPGKKCNRCLNLEAKDKTKTATPK